MPTPPSLTQRDYSELANGDQQDNQPRKLWINRSSCLVGLAVAAAVTVLATDSHIIVGPIACDLKTTHVPYTNKTSHLPTNMTNVSTVFKITSVAEKFISEANNPRYPNDNHKIPGRFMKNKLHFLGVRLTTSYDKFDESVSFDMFGHAVGKGAANAHYDISKLDTQGAFPYDEAKKHPLFCRLHEGNTENVTFSFARNVPMKYIPHVSRDPNPQNAHLLWRCDLSPYISKTHLRQQSHVRVSVFTQKNRYHQNASIPLLTVDVPIDTATVGHAGPLVKSSKEPSFIEKVAHSGPIGVMLCVTGLNRNAMWFLPEFIQHHLNVGVDHIFLGVATKDVLSYLQEKLAYYIEQGVVVLGCEDEVMEDSEIRKMRLYNQCLYHAKGISEYLVNWDVDEMWMPPLEGARAKAVALVEDTNHSHVAHHVMRGASRLTTLAANEADLLLQSSYQTTMSIIEAVRSMQGENGCTDWCYQTFPSYTVKRTHKKPENASHPQQQGFYGFSVREANLNHIWQKPVIQTKYAYQASYHLGGSCSRGSTHSMNDIGDTYQSQFPDCPLRPEGANAPLGCMHHFSDLYRYYGVVDAKDYPNKDEYTQLFRQTVIMQLEALHDKVRPESTL